MADTMGTFRVDIEIENPTAPGTRVELRDVLVASGAMLSCFPAGVLESLGIERQKLVRLRQVDGSVIERWTGGALVHAAGTSTVDDIVFGESNDLAVLGSRSLSGLNRRIDPVAKQLVDAGPILAGAAA
jgi:hypothetical protein